MQRPDTPRVNLGSTLRTLPLLLLLAWPAVAGVHYVDADAVGAGTGNSWADAYTDLQDALDEAVLGDQIWIAEGLYLPSIETAPGDPRSATYLIPDGVALYGGFAGFETSLLQRNWLTNLSILSGDIGASGPTGDNSYHVVTVANTTAPVLLDGLSVVDGRANGIDPLDQRGGGINASEVDLTLKNCRIAEHLSPGLGAALFADGASTQLTLDATIVESNDSGMRQVDGQLLVKGSRLQGNVNGQAAYLGGSLTATFEKTIITLNEGATGAVRLVGASATFRDCTFSDNDAGGISGFSAGNTLIEDCLFENNVTEIGGSAISMSQVVGPLTVRRTDFIGNSTTSTGGAILVHTSKFAMSECRFEGNHADLTGGAVAISFETITGSGGSPITSCTFVGNSAANGGAISATGGQGGFNVFGSSPVLINCLINGNTASERGGAMYVNANSEPQLINTTVSNNSAVIEGGGLYTVQEGFIPEPGIPEVNLANTILWGNTDASGTPWTAQVFPEDGIILYFYCDVEGWDGTGSGLGNFAADPLFVDGDGADDVLGTLDDDLRLVTGSPAIDAGDATALPTDSADLDCDGDTAEIVPLDLGRVVRVDDNVKTPDTGVGRAPQIDLGAWESSAWTHLGNGLGGATGEPCLVGLGTLVVGTTVDHSLTNALPNATGLLFIGVFPINAPFKLGTLVPFPNLVVTLPTSPTGTLSLPATWPAGVPSGASIYMQYWIVDPAGPAGFSASNAVQATQP
ncbi:MAG: right-handed parallel beta-helix repeat-containing protein [Planctomycetota bacterium]|jgi:predicted outer membrane repeat protein